jgi:hypothetical protein
MTCSNGFIKVICDTMMTMYKLKHMLHKGISQKQKHSTNACVVTMSCLVLEKGSS